ALGRRNWSDEVLRAGELDPLSILPSGVGSYRESGQYDLALELIRKKLELYPNAPSLYAALGEIYARKRMYQEAITDSQKSVAISAGDPLYLSGLAGVYAISGKRKEALQIVEQLTVLSKRRY